MNKVNVIGLGYIGLPTAALLANRGFEVRGVDLNQDVLATVNLGKIHIVEPGLESYVKSAVDNGKLVACSEPGPADVSLICVPTPFCGDGEIPMPDMQYLEAATDSLAPFLKAGDILIIESTSPVGTTEMIEKRLAALDVDITGLSIAYCPERILPGNVIHELVHNDRVIGGLTPTATAEAKTFYGTFVKGEILGTDARTAELCKLTENSFRDVNIAFANELSLICSSLGIDVWELVKLSNHHPRVDILQPGPGVGGHCIAVDPWFIVSSDPANARLIRTSRQINDYKSNWVIDQIKIAAGEAANKIDRSPVIACLGLAFKPDIDDLRESPAEKIARSLKTQGFTVLFVEPNISEHGELTLTKIDEALEQADVIAVLVQHSAFRQPQLVQELRDRGALDFCGLLATVN